MTVNAKRTFSFWKITLPIIIGILISVFLIYKSLNKGSIISTEPNEGNLEWVDTNNNNIVDYDDPSDFKKVKNGGDYKFATSKDLISTIVWSSKTLFFFFLAFIFMVGRDLGYIFRLRILSSKTLSLKQCFRSVLLWEFASALSPGVVGGSSVAMFILNKEGIKFGRSTAIVFITALLDNLFYLTIVPFAFLLIPYSILFPKSFTEGFDITSIFIIGYALIFIFSLVLFIGVFIKPQIIKFFVALILRLPFFKRWRNSLEQFNHDVMYASREFRNKPLSFWIKAFGSTVLSWTSRFIVLNCIIMAFIELNFLDNIIAFGRQLMMWVILIVPTLPGASGVAELSFTSFFNDYINNALLVSLIAIIWRLVSYYPYIFIGIIIIPKWLNKKK